MRSISADYSQNPQQKVTFVHIFLSLIISSSRLLLPFDVWPSFPVTMWTLPYADFGKTIAITTERSHWIAIIIFFHSFTAVFNCRSLFSEAAYLAALRRLRSPFAIRDAYSKQSKTKIYEKKITFLLQISAVIGRCGPHLMIVMIFVTQSNLKRSRNFRPSPWILPAAFWQRHPIKPRPISKRLPAEPFQTWSVRCSPVQSF